VVGIPGFLFPSSTHLPQDHRFGMDRKKSGMFLLKQQHKQQQKHQDSTNISTVTPKNKPSISRRQTN